jgi:UDP-4-amino-4,6-dideoxy-N-acetyl-beta-L-altrosamine N-acetyltransferase
MMTGRRIDLRCLEESDLKVVTEWRNQPEIRRSFFTMSLLSYSGQKRWFDQYLQDGSREIFIALSKEAQKPIGMIGIYQIDHRNHHAEIGSTLVGDPAMWGKGIGTEMISMMLDYAFTDLGLHRIYAYALASNTGSIRAKQKCGFQVEGILREAFYGQGSFQDIILVGITRGDWQNQHSEEGVEHDSTESWHQS